MEEFVVARGAGETTIVGVVISVFQIFAELPLQVKTGGIITQIVPIVTVGIFVVQDLEQLLQPAYAPQADQARGKADDERAGNPDVARRRRAEPSDQRRDRRTLRQRAHFVRTTRLENFGDQLRRTDTVTHSKPGESKRLGHRSRQQDWPAAEDEIREIVATELDVGLIDDHESRRPIDDLFNRFPGKCCARRIVGRAKVDCPRARIDHRIDIGVRAVAVVLVLEELLD